MASSPEEDFWEGQMMWYMVAITYPLLLLIGTWGNSVTYHILRRTTQGDRSAGSWLFKCLAVMCLSSLWLALPRHWLRTVYGYDIRKMHYIFCKFHRFLLYTVMDITVWVIVFISFDRLITVFAPSRSNYLCTARNAKIVFIGLAVFFAGFNVHILWAYGREVQRRVIRPAEWLQSNGSTPPPYIKTVILSECSALKDNEDLVLYNKVIHPYASFALYVILPFILMFISSLLIARKTAANRALIKSHEPEPPPIVKRRFIMPGATDANVEAGSGLICQNGADNKVPSVTSSRTNVRQTANRLRSMKKMEQDDESLEKTTTRLTLAACIEYVITATPAFCFDLIENWIKTWMHVYEWHVLLAMHEETLASEEMGTPEIREIYMTPRGEAQYKLVYTTVRLFLFSNFALHFFLFCLTVGRFRKEFRKVLKEWQNIIMIEQRVPQNYEMDDQPDFPSAMPSRNHHDDDYY